MIKMTNEDYAKFSEEWKNACRRVRHSKANLKKIKIIPNERSLQ